MNLLRVLLFSGFDFAAILMMIPLLVTDYYNDVRVSPVIVFPVLHMLAL
jgi:hypothetical protein